MKWGGGTRWRKAWIVSFVLHAVVLTGAGWLVSKALLPAALPETLIELELANEPDSPAGGGGASLPDQWPANSAAAINQPQQPAAQPVMQQVTQPFPQPTVAVEAVVAVSAMSLESVDTSAIVPAGASASGGGESSSGGSGSGGATGSGSGSGSGAGAGSGSGSGRDIIRPSIRSQPKPPYPEAARQAGIEGTVMLRVEVLETGRAGGVSVISSSGSDLLDEAAMEAVQRWRFVPAKVRETGQKIACTVKVPINFELNS